MLPEKCIDVNFHPPSATVQAISNSLVLSIPRKKLAAKLQLDVFFTSRFYHAPLLLLSSRLSDVGSQLGDTIFEKDTYPNPNRIIVKPIWNWLFRPLRGD